MHVNAFKKLMNDFYGPDLMRSHERLQT